MVACRVGTRATTAASNQPLEISSNETLETKTVHETTISAKSNLSSSNDALASVPEASLVLTEPNPPTRLPEPKHHATSHATSPDTTNPSSRSSLFPVNSTKSNKNGKSSPGVDVPLHPNDVGRMIHGQLTLHAAPVVLASESSQSTHSRTQGTSSAGEHSILQDGNVLEAAASPRTELPPVAETSFSVVKSEAKYEATPLWREFSQRHSEPSPGLRIKTLPYGLGIRGDGGSYGVNRGTRSPRLSQSPLSSPELGLSPFTPNFRTPKDFLPIY